MEGAEEPFDPAFGLRRSGRDPANAEFLQGAAHLRGLGPIRELFRHTHRRPGIAVEDAMAIGIGGAGKAIAADELAEEEKIALGILLPAEDGRQDASSCIVNGGEEDQAGAAVFEPGVLAAVHLNEQAGLGHALPAAPMAWGSAGAGAADAGGAQQPLDGLAGEAQALALPEELGEVVIIRASVAGAGEREDAGPYGVGNAPRRRAATVTMGEGREALLTPAREQAAEVAKREAQQRSSFLGPENAMLHPGQDMDTTLLRLSQGHRLPVHAARVTDSLSCWGVTNSWSYYTQHARA